MVMIGGAPVVFKHKYQRTAALSSAEAEDMALSLCTQEVLWARTMLKNLGHEQVGMHSNLYSRTKTFNVWPFTCKICTR